MTESIVSKKASITSYEERREKRIWLNNLTSVLLRVITVITSLGTIPLALGFLGKDQYGLWMAVTAWVAWTNLVDFGLVNSLVNAVSEAEGKNDKEGAATVVSTAFFILVTVCLALLLACLVITPLIPWGSFFSTAGIVADDVVRASFLATFAMFLFSMPLTLVRQVYAGCQLSYSYNLFASVGALASFVGIWIAIHMKASLPVFILIVGSPPLLVSIASFLFLSFWQLPHLRPRLSLVSWAAAKRLSTTSIPLFLYQIGALLVNQTQLIILAKLGSLSLVAEFSIVSRLYLGLSSLISLGTSAYLPPLRESFERGEMQWMKKTFLNMLKFRMAGAFVAAVILIAGGNYILHVWLKASTIELQAHIWWSISLLMVLSIWVTSFADTLIILDRIWVLVPLVLLNGLSTVLLTALLTPTWGFWGIIISNLAFSLFVSSWLVPRLTRFMWVKPC